MRRGLRARDQAAVRLHRRQPELRVPPHRVRERSIRDRAERSDGGAELGDRSRSDRPGVRGLHRPDDVQRDRRPSGFPARSGPIEGRQADRDAAGDGEERGDLADRAAPPAGRGGCDVARRRALRDHGVRGRVPARQDAAAAGGGVWVATLRDGAVRLDSEGKVRERVDPLAWGLRLYDDQGTMRFATQQGLPDLAALPDPRVHALLRTGEGLCIGTEGGLLLQEAGATPRRAGPDAEDRGPRSAPRPSAAPARSPARRALSAARRAGPPRTPGESPRASAPAGAPPAPSP